MDYTKLPCYIDYTKLPCYISYRRSTTVSLETYPIINLHDSQLHTSYARSKRLDVPQNITRWLGLDIFLRREFSQALRFCCSYTDILDLFIVTEISQKIAFDSTYRNSTHTTGKKMMTGSCQLWGTLLSEYQSPFERFILLNMYHKHITRSGAYGFILDGFKLVCSLLCSWPQRLSSGSQVKLFRGIYFKKPV